MQLNPIGSVSFLTLILRMFAMFTQEITIHAAGHVGFERKSSLAPPPQRYRERPLLSLVEVQDRHMQLNPTVPLQGTPPSLIGRSAE